MRLLAKAFVVVLLLTACLEGVNGGLLLMNVADDVAVVAGVLLVLASVLVPASVGMAARKRGWL